MTSSSAMKVLADMMLLPQPQQYSHNQVAAPSSLGCHFNGHEPKWLTDASSWGSQQQGQEHHSGKTQKQHTSLLQTSYWFRTESHNLMSHREPTICISYLQAVTYPAEKSIAVRDGEDRHWITMSCFCHRWNLYLLL